MTRAGKRSWLAALLSLLLLVTMVAPAMAQPPALTSEDAIRFLVEHSIVQGDEQGNLNLDKTITRAELAKVVVVAKGGADLVPILAPLVSFADSKGHWGAGYIEAAARMGLVRGRDANTFDPNAPITYAEALTILLRMVDQEPLVWSPAAVMQRAAQLGIIQGSSLELIANLPAPRGAVFESLTRTMVQVPLADGSTLAKQLDADPPALTVSAPASTAADKVTVAGTATGAYAVTVNGTAATLVDGKFTAEVALKPGANTITVVAYDVAGNQTTQTVTVVRGGDVAAISVSGPTSVKAGESVTLTLRPTDAQGNVLPGSVLTATVSDGMGTMDTATGRFTAGSKAGRATITFTASTGVTETYEIDVLGLAAEAAGLRIRQSSIANGITVGRTGTVVVEVVDAEGNLVSYDTGRFVTLKASGLDGVTIATPTVRTEAGVATFQVRGTEVGEAELQVSSSGLTSHSAAVQFVSSIRVVLTADPPTATANGYETITIRANLVDADGKPVSNTTGEDIYINLEVPSFDGHVSSRTLRIPRGLSNSLGYDGQLTAGYKNESVRVSGSMRSNHDFSIVPVTVTFKEITIGAATKFDIVGGAGKYEPNKPVALTVRVTDKDGNTISNGSYAFQVKVTTSNGEEVIDGLPQGVTLYLGDSGPAPLADVEDAVVARTTNGTAKLTLIYDKSGLVTVEVIGAKATDEAWDEDGYVDKASSGTSLGKGSRDVMFTTFTPTALRAVVDLPSVNLTDQEVGVLPANGSGRATVKVYLTDGEGTLPDGSGTVYLERDPNYSDTTKNTRPSGSSDEPIRAIAKNGIAEFALLSTTLEGVDKWRARMTVGSETIYSAPVTIATYKQKLEQPTILNVTGDQSGYENRVTLEDTGMQIDLVEINSSEAVYGFVKVYRSGSSTPIFTSDVINLASDPHVVVPKEKMKSSDRYQVSVHNGAGESPKSTTWPSETGEYVIVEKESQIAITSVRYDAYHVEKDAAGNERIVSRLQVTAKGVASNGTIDPSKLFFHNTVTGDKEYLSLATCKPSNGSFTCTFADELDAKTFNGSVILDTEDGWYWRDSTGETAKRDETTSDNVVTPTAFIRYASVSFGTNSKGEVTGVLTVYGTNLKQGSLVLSKLTLDGRPLGASQASSVTSTSFKVNLSTTTAGQIKNLGGVSLDAESGWLTATGSFDNAGFENRPVLIEPNISSIKYEAASNKLVIKGSGFLGANVNPGKLVFLDRRYRPVDALNNLLGTIDAGDISIDDDLIEISFGTGPGSLGDELEKMDSGTIYITSDDSDLGETSHQSWLEIDGWQSTPLPRTRLTW